MGRKFVAEAVKSLTKSRLLIKFIASSMLSTLLSVFRNVDIAFILYLSRLNNHGSSNFF
ncbi:hypothetical protein MTR_4g133140 [Medicago truncatula]|uniref:Uncharacterized protein n=1 Tax=Medicago truncatula TaxID=3880 RepID=G7JLL9_MEDTR|nr:hypothetical protein MTR_4g133140 [Medicago truncatula]